MITLLDAGIFERFRDTCNININSPYKFTFFTFTLFFYYNDSHTGGARRLRHSTLVIIFSATYLSSVRWRSQVE